MKPTFKINNIPFQRNSEQIEHLFNPDVLTTLSRQLCSTLDYQVDWIQTRNEGRLAILETDDVLYYISISGDDPQKGRNSYFQSVPTAFSIFLKETEGIKKSREFVVCVQGKRTSHLTKYQNFIARMIVTLNVRIVDVSNHIYCNSQVLPFISINDLILARRENMSRNSGNNPTFITDEGVSYHIYGKTFGANGKETTMLCFVLMSLSQKPIRLFQILDNGEKTISSDDKESIGRFSKLYNAQSIEILDDTYDIDDFSSQAYRSKDTLQLRRPRFIYNLLQKTNGYKKCALCSCEVESLIQAAHIYGVAEIKRNGNYTDAQKIKMATDMNNGLWLCMHHHKLFDSAQIGISQQKITVLSNIQEDVNYISSSIEVGKLSEIYQDKETAFYFSLRNATCL